MVSDDWAFLLVEGFLDLPSSSDDISSTSPERTGGAADVAAFFLRGRLDDFLDDKVPLDGGSSSSEDKTIISLLGDFDAFLVPPLPEEAVTRDR